MAASSMASASARAGFGADGASVYETKTWSSVVGFSGGKGGVSGVAFGPQATTIACGGADGVVKLYGAA